MHKCLVYDVTHCYSLEKKLRSFILIKWLVTAFPHINYVPSQGLASWVKMRSSIYNEVDRFTNERHSTTIGTIGLPRLAR